ncbi:MAG: TonB-dependent receptor [Gammaproteobacteria bacterium]|nr:TonB-dependent receptor [Gammaproteobacteria bacterium]MYC51894.1 TonB-dependent receptor [Gammaproteobacteria bacterium]
MEYLPRNPHRRTRTMQSPWRTTLLAAGVLALFLAPPLEAQENGRITGVVTESGSGGPVSEAQVYLPDQALGGLSRANGRYLIINVPPGTYTVRAERIGLGSAEQEVTVGAGETVTADFVLEELALGLDEIVVTGTAGAARRREIGNSIAQINVTELPDRPVQMVDLLQGAAPGLDLSATGGELGVAPAIRLRGNSSVSMSNNPIIYIDGVRMRSEPLAHVAAPDHRGIRGSNTSKTPLNSINPNDIERIEIIKGSAATTLYGTEASAGVIQIFTKRGSVGAPQWTMESQQGAVWSRKFGNYPDSPFPYLRMEPFLKTGHNQHYMTSVRGGLENLQYFVSGSFSDQEGYLPNEFSTEYITRGNFTFTPLPNFQIQWNTSYSSESAQQLSQSNAQGLGHNVYRGKANYFTDDTPEVIAASVLAFDIRHTIDRFTTGGTFTYTPLADLTNRFTIGYDWLQQDSRNLRPFGFRFRPRGALLNHHWQNRLITFDYVGTYSFDLMDGLRSNFSWGGQAVGDDEHTVEAWGEGFPGAEEPTVNSAAATQGFETRQKVWNAGFFFQNVFDINNKYFITGGVRVDGNSAFGEGFGLQVYPKVSGSWVLSDEEFWDPGMGSLKLRAAWGRSGRAPGAFDAVRTWEAAGLNDQPAFLPQNLGNPDLGPEVTTELEGGFDASFLNDRLAIDFTYYYQKTSDALFAVLQVPSNGFQTSQLENIGELKNEGFEISVNTTPFVSADYEWNLGLNVSTNNSEVLSEDTEFGAGQGTWILTGEPVPVVRNHWVVNPDEIADPVFEQNHVFGPNFPTLNIGPNTSIRLPGGIYISAAGEFKGGHYLRDSNVHPGGITRGAKMPLCWPYYEDKANNTNITLLDSTPALWRARCTPTLIRRIGLVWDADFFRLRSLSAQVPVDFVFPERISSALLTLALNNSYTWKRMPYLDPEMRGNQGGIDLAQAIAARNPTPISFRASLRIQF